MLTNLFFKTTRVHICDFHAAKICTAAHATPRLEHRTTGFGKQISNQTLFDGSDKIFVSKARGDLIKGYYFFSLLHRTPLSTHTQCEHTQLELLRTVVLCLSCTLEILGEIKKANNP